MGGRSTPPSMIGDMKLSFFSLLPYCLGYLRGTRCCGGSSIHPVIFSRKPEETLHTILKGLSDHETVFWICIHSRTSDDNLTRYNQSSLIEDARFVACMEHVK